MPTPTGARCLDTWTREWYEALDAAGIARRGPYHLRHTFATEALAAGISTWELARLMSTSVGMIDRTYGHFARDEEASIRARLEARAEQPGVGPRQQRRQLGRNPHGQQDGGDGAYRDRTGDLRLAKPALSQLS
jgi:hypothetical protein